MLGAILGFAGLLSALYILMGDFPIAIACAIILFTMGYALFALVKVIVLSLKA
jgi:hypothetical protein